MITEHRQYKKLQTEIKHIAGSIVASWEGRVYRCVEPRWAHPQYLISGEGTLHRGGRWLAPGVSPVVHASSTEMTALKESRTAFMYYGISKPRLVPRVSVEIEVELQRTLRLSDVLTALSGVTLQELMSEDWVKINNGGHETLGQAFGRAVYSLGFQALICPAAVDARARNIIWFPENLGKNCQISISHEEKLKNWIED